MVVVMFNRLESFSDVIHSGTVDTSNAWGICILHALGANTDSESDSGEESIRITVSVSELTSNCKKTF